MQRSLTPLIALSLLSLSLGCQPETTATDPEDSDAQGTTGDPTADGECVDDSDCGDDQICEDEVCVTGDRDSSAEEATPLLWETESTATLQSDGDQDYFSFGAEGGEWVRISTEPLGSEELDTVVSLYDPNGKLHHTEDDYPTGAVSTYDTVLYAYLPTAGTWTVLVEDLNGAGGADFDYALLVQESSSHTSESDSFDDTSLTIDAEDASTIWAAGVLLEADGDTDYITLNLPWDDCPVLIYGAAYDGGTDAVATVELYQPDGQRLLRKEGLGPEGLAQYYGADGGQLIIAASSADGGGGAAHWFYVYVLIGDQATWARESEPNDLDTEASPIPAWEWYTSDGYDYAAVSIWGDMADAADEDWYRIEVEDGGYWLHIFGSAGRYGSLMSPSVEVYDAALVPLVGDTFVDDGDTFPDLANLGPVDAGTYFVRVTDAEGGAGLDHNYRISPYLAEFDYNP